MYLLVVTLIIGLTTNLGVTQLTLKIPCCYSFHKSLQIPKTLLRSRIPLCLIDFHGPPRVKLVCGKIQSPTSTMLCFLLQFIILILALKMYFVLISINASGNRNLLKRWHLLCSLLNPTFD